MRIRVNEKHRVIEIWGNTNEGADVVITSEMSRKLKRANYAVCVYKSGTEPVERLTSQLLLGNINQ